MNLNATFAGNVTSESDTDIDVFYQVYYRRLGRVSDVFQTSFYQYHFNAGNQGHLNPGESLVVGDEIAIDFWFGASDRNSPQLKEGLKYLVYDGSAAVVTDIQIGPGGSLTIDPTYNVENGIVTSDTTKSVGVDKVIYRAYVLKSSIMQGVSVDDWVYLDTIETFGNVSIEFLSIGTFKVEAEGLDPNNFSSGVSSHEFTIEGCITVEEKLIPVVMKDITAQVSMERIIRARVEVQVDIGGKLQTPDKSKILLTSW